VSGGLDSSGGGRAPAEQPWGGGLAGDGRASGRMVAAGERRGAAGMAGGNGRATGGPAADELAGWW
jgi:hypothetical protein